MDGCQNDRAAGMDRHVYFVADLDPREIHERRIKDDALGISDFRNRLGHDVILCFTNGVRQHGMMIAECGLFRKGRSKKEGRSKN